MSVLTNPRHECFALELAKGETAERSYELAGYKRSRPHASRLATRIAEILAQAAHRAEISVAGQTRRLLRLAAKAERMADGQGGPAAINVARAAHMDICRRVASDWTRDELVATINDRAPSGPRAIATAKTFEGFCRTHQARRGA